MSSQRLMILLERLGLLERTDRRERARRLGLPEVQLAILDYLARCNPYSDTLRDVSDYLGITPGTLSQSLKQLEDRGLVHRQRDEHDRRVWHLRLTRQGRQLAAEAASPLAGLLRRWPEEDVAALERLLRRLLTDAQRENGFRTFAQCATCRHLLVEGDGYRCGLTRERLQPSRTLEICRDHAFADQASSGNAKGGR